MNEGSDTKGPPPQATDWRFSYQDVRDKLEQSLRETADLRQRLEEQEQQYRLLTEEIRRLSRYETSSLLMGTLAYDVNNLLTIIKGYSEMMKDRMADVVIQAEVEEVIKAADRAAAIVKQLLSLQLYAAREQVRTALVDP